MLDENYNLKVIDLGLCADNSRILETNMGTYFYKAPEINYNIPYLGHVVDFWAANICLFTFVTGAFPFSKADRND